MSERPEKKIYKKSMFFDTKPSVRGVASIFFGIACVLIIIAGLVFSYIKGGNAGTIVGSLALTSLLLSVIGIFLAFTGFREEDRNYLPCKIGVIWCGCVAVFVIFLFFTGL